MASMIYNPLEEYDGKFKELHLENTKSYFSELVTRSGIDIEENRKTVKAYDEARASLKKMKKRFNLWRFLRVIMIITLILIPLVIWKITPKIKAMRTEISDFETKIAELLATCQRQMAPLNELFSCDDAVRIIEKTVPGLSFKSSFTVDMERNMIKNFDFCDHTD